MSRRPKVADAANRVDHIVAVGTDAPDHRGGPVSCGSADGRSRRPITFRCDREAHSVTVVGEFNDWSTDAMPMQRTDAGFELTIPLPIGESYRYKYLVDGLHWENDIAADDYVENAFGGYDSVRNV